MEKPTKSIDKYIAAFPKDIQSILKKLRQTIRKAAPGAQEMISYQMPTFKLNGKYLVYFAAWKNHIGFYPTSLGINKQFTKDLARYEISKGTIKFPIDQRIPYELVTKIVKYRVKQSTVRQ